MRKLVVLLGTPVDSLDMPETLDRIEEMIHAGRLSGKYHQVVTANTDFLVKARKDTELRKVIQQADLCTADGMPLVWGARLLGVPIPGRVAGADLVPLLAQRAAQKGFSLYFLGAEPGIAAQAARILQDRYPGLQIAGIESPPFQPIEKTQPEVLARIRAANPDVLLVAFGNPKQEKWIARFGAEIKVPVMIGVGGSLDFIAGKTRRAPRWMQNNGLEWFYRLIQEPRRLWQRYAVDLVVFIRFFLRQWWATRQGLRPFTAASTMLPTTDLLLIDDTAVITIDRRMTAKDRETFQATARQALAASSHIIVNLEKATFLDSSAIGALVGMAKQAHDAGGKLWLCGAQPSVQQTLKLLQLDTFFANGATISGCLTERFNRPAVRRESQPV
jgi:N-acetylglucosaminyldiphosphoundecaprenol N-acetyl-beta-D-mannosaminyltransferase